jgi:hypothetical protein
VRNVELFHRLMQIQVDWLSDAETRLFTLRRPSRLVNSAQQQLDAHRVIDANFVDSVTMLMGFSQQSSGFICISVLYS